MATNPLVGYDLSSLQMMYDPEKSPEAWKDAAPLDQDWLQKYREGSYTAAASAIRDGGMAPTNNLIWTGQGRPDPVVAGADGKKPNGFWNYMGPGMTSAAGYGGDGNGMQMDSQYQWVEQQAPAAPAPAAVPQERAPDAAPDPNKPTIYDGFNDYIDIARGEDQGRNRMPFVFGGGYGEGQPTYQDVPYNPILALEQVYPSGRNSFRDKLTDPLNGEQLVPYGPGGGGTGMPGGSPAMGGMQTGSRNKEPVDPTKRSGYYENYGAPGYVGVPNYGGVPSPDPFASTYPGVGTGYAALPTYRAR